MSQYFKKQNEVDYDQLAAEDALHRPAQPESLNLIGKFFLSLIHPFVASCLLTSCAPPTTPASTSTSPTTVIETQVSAPYAKRLPATTELGGLAQTGLVEDTDHCTIYYPEGEQASASFIGVVLEDNLERVSTDLGYRPQEKIKVFIYSDLETFHEAIELPDAPEWVVAAGYIGGIQMVTPRLISGDILDKTVVHELTHALQGQINPDAPFWMIEGIAAYEADMFEGVQETLSKGIDEKDIPPLASLDTMDTEGFGHAGGYAYSYTVVEFVVQTYGKAILAEWIKTPRDYERVFGVSAETFEKHWRNWLVDTYIR